MKRYEKKSFIVLSFLISFSLHILIIIFFSLPFFNNENKFLEKKIQFIPVELILSENIQKNINSKIIKNNIENENDEKNNRINPKINNKIKDKSILEDEAIKDSDNFSKEEEKNISLDNFGDNVGSSDSFEEEEKQISTGNNSVSSQEDFNQENITQYSFNSKENDNSEFDLNNFIKNISNYSLNLSYLFKYPSDALKLGISGTVKLKIAIGKEGKVIDVVLLESSGSKILDNYTKKQAYQLLFKIPEKLNIQFPIWVTLKIVYMIKSNVTVSTE